MKKVVIAGAVVIILLILGLIFIEPNDKESSMTGLEAATLLKPLAKDVSLSLSADSESSVIDEEIEVASGNKITTSAAGRALLTQGSEIVTSVDSNSELTLDLNKDEKSTVIKMAAGKTWTKITRALEQDEVYEVHTPTIVAAVRGTSFGVYTEPESQIIVTEGTVWASVIDPETGLADPETTIKVPAGKMVIYKDGKLVVRDIGEDDKGEWYFENNPESNDNEEESATSIERETNIKPVIPTTPTNNPDTSIGNDETVTNEDSTIPAAAEEDGGGIEAAGEIGADAPAEPAVTATTQISLSIKSAKIGSTQSPEEYVILTGTGFTQVETVLVNGQENPFQNIGDTEIHVFNFSLSNVRTIEIVSSTDSVTYTP